MGLAVLPSRLKNEMELLADYIMEQRDIAPILDLRRHFGMDTLIMWS